MPREKLRKFKMEKNYYLIIQEIDGLFFLLWKHKADPIAIQHWIKTGDNKILLPVINIEQAKAFISVISIMFNASFKSVSEKFPSFAFIVEVL